MNSDTSLREPPRPHAAVAPTAGTPAPTAVRPIIDAHDLSRQWGKGAGATLGVDRVALTIDRGELVAIVGPSGSGKSTLGALIAGIDRPTSGSLVVDGIRIDQLKNDELTRWRGERVGIVFQDFHLLPTLTASENVELAIEFSDRRSTRSDRRERVRDALDRVGLERHARKLPNQMSGGEQQRVAIARALATRPSIVVADEPTGSLDQANGHAVFELLLDLAGNGTTVVFITHDPALAEQSDRVVEMLDGSVIGTRPGHGVDEGTVAR